MSIVVEVKDVYRGDEGKIYVSLEYVVDGVPEPSIDVKSLFPEQLAALTKEEALQELSHSIGRTCREIRLNNERLVSGVSYKDMREAIVDEQIVKIKTHLVGKTITKD